MVQSVERAGEACGLSPDRREPRARIPGAGGTGVDVAAERVIPGQVAAHALQVGGGRAALRTQAGDDGVVAYRAIRTEQGTEVVSGGKIDLRPVAQGVTAGVAGSHRALAVLQGEAGGPGSVQVGVEVDVVLGVEGELACAPADGGDNVQIVGGTPGAGDGAAGQADVVALLGTAEAGQYGCVAARRSAAVQRQSRRSTDDIAGDRAGNAGAVIADVGQRSCAAVIYRRQRDRREEVAQQRRAAALVDAPNGTAAARVGDVPAAEARLGHHLRSGQARAAAGGACLAGCVLVPVAAADRAAGDLSHQPTDVGGGGRYAARGVGVADILVKAALSHQSADIVVTADAARGVAVADYAVVRVETHQPANGIAAAADAARRVACLDPAPVVPDQPADQADPADVTRGVAIDDPTGVVAPHQSADVTARAGDRGRRVVVGERVAAVKPGQSADASDAADAARDVVVADRALVDIPYQPADDILPRHIGIEQPKVLNRGELYVSKQT